VTFLSSDLPSEEWAETIRSEEQSRIVGILLELEKSCDCGHCRRAAHYMDSILYLVNRKGNQS
jgi:hypothetical protein